MEKQDKNNFVQSIYCYEGTNILKNKSGIVDKNQLEQLERSVFTYKLIKLINDHELNDCSFKVAFDAEHYLDLHKYLFGDIYDFAGEVRSEAIVKRNPGEIEGEEGLRTYCYPTNIHKELKRELNEMKSEVRGIKDHNCLVDFLVKHYFNLYFIHPFRDGNSRTLREFLREYVVALNKLVLKFEDVHLDYTYLNPEDNDNFVRAVMWNVSSDKDKQVKSESLLKNIFSKCLINEDMEHNKLK